MPGARKCAALLLAMVCCYQAHRALEWYTYVHCRQTLFHVFAGTRDARCVALEAAVDVLRRSPWALGLALLGVAEAQQVQHVVAAVAQAQDVVHRQRQLMLRNVLHAAQRAW